MPRSTTSAVQPSLHPLTRLLVRQRPVRFHIRLTTLDLLQHVQVVLDAFQRAVIGPLFQQLFAFLFGGCRQADVAASRADGIDRILALLIGRG